MAESFITVLNGVITGKHHGDINCTFEGTEYHGHEKIPVPFEALITHGESVNFYDKWQRKTTAQLAAENLIPIPQGYKLVDGVLLPMTMPELLTAGQITQGQYDEYITAKNENEFQRRLSELQTPEAIARVEVDEDYAAERKAKLIALLAVKQQAGWPLEVTWPAE